MVCICRGVAYFLAGIRRRRRQRNGRGRAKNRTGFFFLTFFIPFHVIRLLLSFKFDLNRDNLSHVISVHNLPLTHTPLGQRGRSARRGPCWDAERRAAAGERAAGARLEIAHRELPESVHGHGCGARNSGEASCQNIDRCFHPAYPSDGFKKCALFFSSPMQYSFVLTSLLFTTYDHHLLT